jgi:hypothetical protein
LIGVCIAGCAGNSTTSFAAGLDPLENDTADWPAPAGNDPHPETIQFAVGSADSYDWAHARAYVHGSITDTWKALKDPDACVDRHNVTSWTVTQNVEPQYTVSFRIHNVVEDIVTVEFENTWRQGATEGTVEEPITVVGRFKKTWGSNYIDLMEGSIVLHAIDDNTTSMELEEHIDAMGQGSSTAVTTLRGVFDSVVAEVHGQPLP